MYVYAEVVVKVGHAEEVEVFPLGAKIVAYGVFQDVLKVFLIISLKNVFQIDDAAVFEIKDIVAHVQQAVHAAKVLIV